MGLSTSEIQLLIRARDEAKGTLDNLGTEIRVVTSAAEAASVGMDRLGTSTKNAGAATTASVVGVDRLATGLSKAGQAATVMSQAGQKAAEDLAREGGAWLLDFGHAVTLGIEHPLDLAKGMTLGFIDLLGPFGVGLTAIGGIAAAAGVALLGMGKATYELAQRAAGVGAHIKDMSDIMSTSVEKTSNLKYAMDVAGGSIEQASNLIFTMQKRMAENPDDFERGLARINLRLKDLDGKSPTQQLLTISAAFRENTDQSNRAATAIELFSLQGRNAIPLLMNPLDELVAKSKELGFEWSEKDAQAAQALEMATRAMHLEFDKLSIDIGKELIPALTFVVVHTHDIKEAIKDTLDPLGLLRIGLMVYHKQLDDLDTMTRTFTGDMGALPKVVGATKVAHDALWQSLGQGTVVELNEKTALRDLEAQHQRLVEAQKKHTAEAKKASEELTKHTEAARKLEAGFYGLHDAVGLFDKSEVDLLGHLLASRAAIDTIERSAWLAAFGFNGMADGLERIGEHNDFSMDIAVTSVKQLTDAYHEFGLKTPAELRKVAEASARNYDILRQNGTATTKELTIAYQKMIDDQRAASGKLPSLWESEIAPRIKDTLGQISTAAQGSFAQIILGAKGFKDGMLDIWSSMKAGVTKILADILNYFLSTFLKGMLAGMTGGAGGFSGAFAGMFSGGAGGGGLLGSVTGGGGGQGGLGSLVGGFGGGGSIANPGIGAYGVPNSLSPTGGSGAAGGAGMLGNLARFGGGGLMAGMGLYELFKAKTTGQNVMAGMQTGAGIGTMIMPGIGTAIGAGVGALGGYLKAKFGGPSQEEKEGRQSVKEFEDLLHRVLTTQQQVEAGGESWKQTTIAVRDAYLKVGKSEKDALADVAALWNASKGGAGEVEKAITPIAAAFQQIEEQAAKAGTAVEENQTQSADTAANAFDVAVQRIKVALARLGPEAEQIRIYIENELGDLSIRIPVGFDVDTLPIPEHQTSVPGAAGGIYATGQRGVATWFGEGGQPEVGGPRSFFKEIFESLGISGGARSGGTGGGDTYQFNVTVMDAAGFQQAVEGKILPTIIAAVNGNKRQTRTDLRTALGVA